MPVDHRFHTLGVLALTILIALTPSVTGVALRVWHGSLARRRKTEVLITDVCRRAS